MADWPVVAERFARSLLQARTDGPPDYDACIAALAHAIHRRRDPAVAEAA